MRKPLHHFALHLFYKCHRCDRTCSCLSHFSLDFKHPASTQWLICILPIPKYFQKWVIGQKTLQRCSTPPKNYFERKCKFLFFCSKHSLPMFLNEVSSVASECLLIPSLKIPLFLRISSFFFQAVSCFLIEKCATISTIFQQHSGSANHIVVWAFICRSFFYGTHLKRVIF